MSCNNCGKEVSNRYTEHNKDFSGDSNNGNIENYEALFSEVNTFSLNTLLKMREDIRSSEEKKYKEMLKFMSDDLKALKILTFVKIFNGEEFSQEGHSPEYCLEMLKLMSDYEGTSYVFDRFKGLRQQVYDKYDILQKKRIIIENE